MPSATISPRGSSPLGLPGRAAPLRADRGRLPAVLPQALPGLVVDGQALPPAPAPLHDHGERPVTRPGRQPPDALRRAGQREAPPGDPGHPEQRRAARADPGATQGRLQRPFLRQSRRAARRREVALRRGDVQAQQPRVRRGPSEPRPEPRGWVDGKLVIERTDVVLRSTDFPRMRFNQFLILPYFHRGVPHDQALWIDGLAVEGR
jgi:hypothetical protein